MRRYYHRIISTPARLVAVVGLVYFLSSFFSTTIREVLPLPGGEPSLRYRNNYWAVVSLPRVLRGDEMYYLMMAHSLAHDGDLRLSREYTHVQQGGPEMGIYHRGRGAANFLQHFSRLGNFTLVGNHPFGLSALLAMLLWPLAGSVWMEPAAIWVTILFGVMGVAVFLRVMEALGVPWGRARNAAMILAFATPWWSYSRTLYTEVYIGLAFLIVVLAVLRNRALWALPFTMAMAWFKYPALLLFLGAGTGEAVQRRLRTFLIYGVTGMAIFAAIFLANRSIYEGAAWVTRVDNSLPPTRSVARAGAPIAWLPGNVLDNIERLFTDFDKGIFPHCPLLFVAITGLGVMARRRRRQFLTLMASIVPWTVLHLTYRFLMSGDSYTTRYLVPMVPLVLVGLPWYWDFAAGRSRWWRWGATVLIGVSLFNNILAGIFPALTFDRKPWEVWYEFILILKAAIVGPIGS